MLSHCNHWTCDFQECGACRLPATKQFFGKCQVLPLILFISHIICWVEGIWSKTSPSPTDVKYKVVAQQPITNGYSYKFTRAAPRIQRNGLLTYYKGYTEDGWRGFQCKVRERGHGALSGHVTLQEPPYSSILKSSKPSTFLWRLWCMGVGIGYWWLTSPSPFSPPQRLEVPSLWQCPSWSYLGAASCRYLISI